MNEEDIELKRFLDRGGVRISNILEPYRGYANIPPEVLERAANRGKRVHEWINDKLAGIYSWDDIVGIEGYIKSFERFWIATKPKILKLEKRYYNEEDMITGQIDLLAEVDGRPVIIDWKTSSSFNKTYPLQGAAYSSLVETDTFKVDNVIFVKLSKEGKDPDILEIKPEDYIGSFYRCLDVYREFFANKISSDIDYFSNI